jgi:hypothetical protein
MRVTYIHSVYSRVTTPLSHTHAEAPFIQAVLVHAADLAVGHVEE